jgi:hypothetical protein
VGLEKRGIGRVSKLKAGREKETRRKNDENKRETAGLLNAGGESLAGDLMEGLIDKLLGLCVGRHCVTT